MTHYYDRKRRSLHRPYTQHSPHSPADGTLRLVLDLTLYRVVLLVTSRQVPCNDPLPPRSVTDCPRGTKRDTHDQFPPVLRPTPCPCRIRFLSPGVLPTPSSLERVVHRIHRRPFSLPSPDHTPTSLCFWSDTWFTTPDLN